MHQGPEVREPPTPSRHPHHLTASSSSSPPGAGTSPHVLAHLRQQQQQQSGTTTPSTPTTRPLPRHVVNSRPATTTTPTTTTTTTRDFTVSPVAPALSPMQTPASSSWGVSSGGGGGGQRRGVVGVGVGVGDGVKASPPTSKRPKINTASSTPVPCTKVVHLLPKQATQSASKKPAASPSPSPVSLISSKPGATAESMDSSSRGSAPVDSLVGSDCVKKPVHLLPTPYHKKPVPQNSPLKQYMQPVVPGKQKVQPARNAEMRTATSSIPNKATAALRTPAAPKQRIVPMTTAKSKQITTTLRVGAGGGVCGVIGVGEGTSSGVGSVKRKVLRTSVPGDKKNTNLTARDMKGVLKPQTSMKKVETSSKTQLHLSPTTRRRTEAKRLNAYATPARQPQVPASANSGNSANKRIGVLATNTKPSSKSRNPHIPCLYKVPALPQDSATSVSIQTPTTYSFLPLDRSEVTPELLVLESSKSVSSSTDTLVRNTMEASSNTGVGFANETDNDSDNHIEEQSSSDGNSEFANAHASVTESLRDTDDPVIYTAPDTKEIITHSEHSSEDSDTREKNTSESDQDMEGTQEGDPSGDDSSEGSEESQILEGSPSSNESQILEGPPIPITETSFDTEERPEKKLSSDEIPRCATPPPTPGTPGKRESISTERKIYTPRTMQRISDTVKPSPDILACKKNLFSPDSQKENYVDEESTDSASSDTRQVLQRTKSTSPVKSPSPTKCPSPAKSPSPKKFVSPVKPPSPAKSSSPTVRSTSPRKSVSPTKSSSSRNSVSPTKSPSPSRIEAKTSNSFSSVSTPFIPKIPVNIPEPSPIPMASYIFDTDYISGSENENSRENESTGFRISPYTRNHGPEQIIPATPSSSKKRTSLAVVFKQHFTHSPNIFRGDTFQYNNTNNLGSSQRRNEPQQQLTPQSSPERRNVQSPKKQPTETESQAPSTATKNNKAKQEHDDSPSTEPVNEPVDNSVIIQDIHHDDDGEAPLQIDDKDVDDGSGSGSVLNGGDSVEIIKSKPIGYQRRESDSWSEKESEEDRKEKEKRRKKKSPKERVKTGKHKHKTKPKSRKAMKKKTSSDSESNSGSDTKPKPKRKPAQKIRTKKPKKHAQSPERDPSTRKRPRKSSGSSSEGKEPTHKQTNEKPPKSKTANQKDEKEGKSGTSHKTRRVHHFSDSNSDKTEDDDYNPSPETPTPPRRVKRLNKKHAASKS
ncbi:hypothetical protein Pelo_3201 [Pelomyxa schiedti]|nr:hypothetical protein Pelo_3201 [Pelomyxa schiedti]